MNEEERLRAEFDAEFLKDLAAAEADARTKSPRENPAANPEAIEADSEIGDETESAASSFDPEKELSSLAPFTRAVVETIREIPPGRVMSYGQVAAAAGSPRGARQVVRILHSMSRKYGLPWHRVVNIRGEIALDENGGGGEQQERLRAEGVEFGLGGRIDLERYRHEAGGNGG
ncbi:MGMT family protein [Saccharibacillus endophyticus]|uniref:Methylated-DNA-[protein]-cysteine S-methyltransferase DNA binding domain-containing protein n=1 Tax=Saccharibacillus endophyticus TaxID=2060666 RepID=A0ABQ1ZWJ2_9BACL|nr:MGMT family protein [Saccharibacillus endophyticus]GGH79433.1 hypothetical protein GCM10007362_26220 [Saccharibacillus endophyticus]